MGLFDSMTSAVLTQLAGGERGAMLQLGLDLLQDHGGLPGILEKFREQGYAREVQSWLGDGDNLPLTSQQVAEALDGDLLRNIAAKFDMSVDDVCAKLAKYLPGLVDKLTPDGDVPADNTSLLVRGLPLLKRG